MAGLAVQPPHEIEMGRSAAQSDDGQAVSDDGREAQEASGSAPLIIAGKSIDLLGITTALFQVPFLPGPCIDHMQQQVATPAPCRPQNRPFKGVVALSISA